MPERIYIVEDNAIAAFEIRRSIEKFGYDFAGMASSYDDALQGIQASRPDLILMDIMLEGDQSGIELAQTLDILWPVPIIFLTSVTDEKTMHEAIRTAPASYLLKPFRREELQSAILLSLHAASAHPLPGPEIIPLNAQCRYHPRKRQLLCDDSTVHLGTKEHRLFEALLYAKGEIVPFGILEERIWGGEPVSDGALRTLLYRLRSKLKPLQIETISSLGCRLVLP